MFNLIGTYECKADVKGRVMVPIALKKQIAPVSTQGFVIKRAVFQPCLELYPMEEWRLLMEKMGKLNRFNRKNNDLKISGRTQTLNCFLENSFRGKG